MVLVLVLFLADFGNDPVNEFNDGMVDVVSLVNGADHLVVRDLIGTGFDHDDLFTRRGNGQTKVSLVPLFLGGIDDKLPVHLPDLGHGNRTVKGNV